MATHNSVGLMSLYPTGSRDKELKIEMASSDNTPNLISFRILTKASIHAFECAIHACFPVKYILSSFCLKT